MKRGMARFWYRLKNDYFRKEEGPGEPITFLFGSEDELRRVTTWVCHLFPSLFEFYPKVTLHYTAKDGQHAGGGHMIPPHVVYLFRILTQMEQRLLQSWLNLVWQYNTFVGTEWTGQCADCRIKDCMCFRDSYTKESRIISLSWEGFWEIRCQVRIHVYPPSAHERAEALLSLSEWLDGKVSEQEKRELLQLPDDIEV